MIDFDYKYLIIRCLILDCKCFHFHHGIIFNASYGHAIPIYKYFHALCDCKNSIIWRQFKAFSKKNKYLCRRYVVFCLAEGRSNSTEALSTTTEGPSGTAEEPSVITEQPSADVSKAFASASTFFATHITSNTNSI